MTFLAILGKLCNLRLVLEGKIGKEILESSRLEVSEKILANKFAKSDAEDNTVRSLNTNNNSPKVPRA